MKHHGGQSVARRLTCSLVEKASIVSFTGMGSSHLRNAVWSPAVRGIRLRTACGTRKVTGGIAAAHRRSSRGWVPPPLSSMLQEVQGTRADVAGGGDRGWVGRGLRDVLIRA